MYIIYNPPYGVERKKDKIAVENEYKRGFAGRFGAGLPRISDGQYYSFTFSQSLTKN